MLSTRRAIAIALASLAASTSAKVLIKNQCTIPVHVVQSHNGGCDYGPAGPDVCVAGGPGKPWSIQPGGVLDVPYLSDSDAVAIKVSKSDPTKISQVEYCASDQRYWDLSDIDGDGAARTGSPFYHDNVGLIPSGSGLGAGTCKPVLCQGGQQCEDAYQFPDQSATRVCPLDTGDLVLELCMDQQELDVLLQRWYPDGARTNFGMDSGLQGHASYEGNSNNDQEYGNGNGQDCQDTNGQPCQNSNGQQCLDVNGQPCQTSNNQQCLDVNGQPCQNGAVQECQTANGQDCPTTGAVPQTEPIPPAPATASVPATVSEQETTNNSNNDNNYNANSETYNGRGDRHRPMSHHQEQKRNATPSMRPRPRHLRAHQHQGHKRRMHARRVATAGMKE